MNQKLLRFYIVLILLGCLLSGCERNVAITPAKLPLDTVSQSQITSMPSMEPSVTTTPQATVEPTKTSSEVASEIPKKAVILPNMFRQQVMNQDESAVLLNADFSYPQIENLSGLDTIDLINQQIKDTVEQEFNKSVEEGKQFAKDFFDYHEKQGRPSSLLPFVTEQTYEVKYNDNYMISVLVTSYSYFGGAHPNILYSSYTYHLLTGEKLPASYFLPGKMTKEDVKQYVAEMFYTVYNEEQERFYPDAGETLSQGKFEYGFYITEEEIIFYMNPYVIAPYAAGVQEVGVDIKGFNTLD